MGTVLEDHLGSIGIVIMVEEGDLFADETDGGLKEVAV